MKNRSTPNTVTQDEIDSAGRKFQIATMKGKNKNRKLKNPLPTKSDRSKLDLSNPEVVQIADDADDMLLKIRGAITTNGKPSELTRFSSIELVLDPTSGKSNEESLNYGSWDPSGGKLKVTVFVGTMLPLDSSQRAMQTKLTVGHELIGHSLDEGSYRDPTLSLERRADAMARYLYDNL